MLERDTTGVAKKSLSISHGIVIVAILLSTPIYVGRLLVRCFEKYDFGLVIAFSAGVAVFFLLQAFLVFYATGELTEDPESIS